jgi:hypothetical protein
MQRGIINKVYIKYATVFILFLYDSISVIYSFLPPLFGLVSLYIYKSLDEDDKYFLFAMTLYLLIFEANRNFLLFSTILFFAINYYYIIPKLSNITTCKKCLYPIYISLSYIGYFLFTLVLSFMLNVHYINFDYIVVYYILIEIIIALVWL